MYILMIYWGLFEIICIDTLLGFFKSNMWTGRTFAVSRHNPCVGSLTISSSSFLFNRLTQYLPP